MLISSSNTKMVMCLGTGSIFDDSLAALLSSNENINVYRVKYLSDEHVIDIIKNIHPDVVLFHETGTLNKTRLLDLIASIPSITGFRVGFVRLWDNLLDLYDRSAEPAANFERTTVTITSSIDLINAVSCQSLTKDYRPSVIV